MTRPFCPPAPCPECPFTRGPKAVRLTRGRIQELTANMLSPAGLRFACHKTVRYDADEPDDRGAQHCTGALIFAEKHDTVTQWMRWMERIGIYRREELKGQDAVFDTTAEMLATAIDGPRRQNRRTW